MTGSVVLKIIYFALTVFASRIILISARYVCDPDVPSRPTPEDWISESIFDNCPAGTYKELANGRCQPCPAGHFMTKQMAGSSSFSFCEKCYEVNSVEVVAEPCTTTRDAVIHCEEGYYRQRTASNHCSCCWECRRCDVCGVGANLNLNYLMAECHNYSNTLCCRSKEVVVVNDSCVVDSAAVEKLAIDFPETSPESASMKQGAENYAAKHAETRELCARIALSITFLHYLGQIISFGYFY